ncbi:MAG: hypothetical protein KA190_06765 [Kofleriaceae bacterium]|nr:hypothetical protein [Kofleriaceae bacterium]
MKATSCLLLAGWLAACGGRGAQVETAPFLPGETAPVEPAGGVAGAGGDDAGSLGGGLEPEDERVFPAEGPPCMPAGAYTVAVDLGPAQLDIVGQPPEYCRSMLTAVPMQQRSQLELSYPDGKLVVRWPEYTIVRVLGECRFQVMTPPLPVILTFEAGRGTGNTDYSVGSSNHTDERCAARGAVLQVEPVGS